MKNSHNQINNIAVTFPDNSIVFIGVNKLSKRPQLSIIIPVKNEEKYIGQLLDSISKQHIPFYYEIIVADACSTDRTIDIVKSYSDRFPNLRVIPGGLPAVGRNAGAKASNGQILLFIDADCSFDNPNLISTSVLRFLSKGYQLATASLNARDGFLTKVLYFLSNVSMHLSKLDRRPFAVGSFMMMNKDKFKELGGFNEQLFHCEDYFLSRQIQPSKFLIIDGRQVYVDGRRFKKTGWLGMIKYFIKNIINRNNIEYFKRDINYWN